MNFFSSTWVNIVNLGILVFKELFLQSWKIMHHSNCINFWNPLTLTFEVLGETITKAVKHLDWHFSFFSFASLSYFISLNKVYNIFWHFFEEVFMRMIYSWGLLLLRMLTKLAAYFFQSQHKLFVTPLPT